MANIEEKDIPKYITLWLYTYVFKEKKLIIIMFIDAEILNVML